MKSKTRPTALTFLVSLVMSLSIGAMVGLLLVPATARAVAAERCWNIDACSSILGCRMVSRVPQIIMPSQKKLWRSGPQEDIVCVRWVYEKPGCRGRSEHDNYTSVTCGEPIPITIEAKGSASTQNESCCSLENSR